MPTVFPQSITIANTWDEGTNVLMLPMQSQMKARAKYHEFQRRGKTGIYQVSLSGHQTSIYFAIPDGEEGTKLTVRILI